ncbi:MAG: hypothetical protein AAF990_19990 [Bacteroidota bacterium]
MKNLILISALTSFLLLISCSKDAPLLSEASPNTERPQLRSTPSVSGGVAYEQSGGDEQGSDLTIEVEVSSSQLSNTAVTLTIDYISDDEDLANIELKTEQHLQFKDAQEETQTLNVTIDDQSVHSDTLQVVYLLNGQSLTNLELMELQEIIIEDIVIN